MVCSESDCCRKECVNEEPKSQLNTFAHLKKSSDERTIDDRLSMLYLVETESRLVQSG